MRCPNCQASNESYASKCQFCGTPLKDSYAEMKPPAKDVVLGKTGSAPTQGSVQTSKEEMPEMVVPTPKRELEQAGLSYRKAEKKRSVGVTIVGITMLIYSLWLLYGFFSMVVLYISFKYHIEKLSKVIPAAVFRLLYGNSYTFGIFYNLDYVALLGGLIYLISGIGLLRLRNWSRIVAVYFSAILIATLIFITAILRLTLMKTLIVALPLPLLFLILLTRPQVKEQFR